MQALIKILISENMLYVQTPSAVIYMIVHCYQKLVPYLSVHGKLLILNVHSNFVMKNSKKADLSQIKHLFIYHLLFGFKNFIVPKHLKSFFPYKRGIHQVVGLWVTCGMVEFGIRLIEIVTLEIVFFLRMCIMLL